jgi:hypothetical protein
MKFFKLFAFLIGTNDSTTEFEIFDKFARLRTDILFYHTFAPEIRYKFNVSYEAQSLFIYN